MYFSQVVDLLIAIAKAACMSPRCHDIFDPYPTVVSPGKPKELAFSPNVGLSSKRLRLCCLIVIYCLINIYKIVYIPSLLLQKNFNMRKFAQICECKERFSRPAGDVPIGNIICFLGFSVSLKV